jgi:hypothetical protein
MVLIIQDISEETVACRHQCKWRAAGPLRSGSSAELARQAGLKVLAARHQSMSRSMVESGHQYYPVQPVIEPIW